MAQTLPELKALLKSRLNQPGYERNVEEIKRRIAEMEAQDQAPSPS